MIVPMQGVIVALPNKPEATDRKTGDVIPAKSFIEMLIAEKEGFVVKRISCSPAFQQRYKDGVMRLDSIPKQVTLQVDLNMWEMNGRTGLGITAVESK